MSLKPELKKAVAEVLKSNGMPPMIDKTFLSMWETFAKTQPSALNTTGEGPALRLKYLNTFLLVKIHG
jgi:hypothetical protein